MNTREKKQASLWREILFVSKDQYEYCKRAIIKRNCYEKKNGLDWALISIRI